MFILDADLVPVREIGLEAVYQKPRSLKLAAASRTYLNRVLGRRGGEETGKYIGIARRDGSEWRHNI
jgi:hypothetical protein